MGHINVFMVLLWVCESQHQQLIGVSPKGVLLVEGRINMLLLTFWLGKIL